MSSRTRQSNPKQNSLSLKECFWGGSLQDRLLAHWGLGRLDFISTFCFVVEDKVNNKEMSFYRHCFL